MSGTLKVLITLAGNTLDLEGEIPIPDVRAITDGFFSLFVSPFESGHAAQQLEQILARLQSLQRQEHREMTQLTDIQAKLVTLRADVEGETDVVTSVKTLLEGQNALLVSLRQQLADAIANNDPVALQAVLDAIDTITVTNATNKQATVDAVVANTPAPPPA
jgi:excinuclease UvrABC nuclease subunit